MSIHPPMAFDKHGLSKNRLKRLRHLQGMMFSVDESELKPDRRSMALLDAALRLLQRVASQPHRPVVALHRGRAHVHVPRAVRIPSRWRGREL